MFFTLDTVVFHCIWKSNLAFQICSIFMLLAAVYSWICNCRSYSGFKDVG